MRKLDFQHAHRNNLNATTRWAAAVYDENGKKRGVKKN